MKRTQIYLEENLAEELAAAAVEEGRSGAALIRDALREYLERRERRPRRKSALDDFIGIYEGSPDASITVDQVLYGGPYGK